MLSFLSPLFLLGALTAAIPVVLHLLRREPEPKLRFAAVRLLRHAPIEHTERRRLREWLLLALRVAALVLLALAFARPFLASGAAVGPARATIVVLDRSLSLSAPGVFTRARRMALDAIDAAAAGDLVGVVTFDDLAAIAQEPAADRSLSRAAVNAAQPGLGGTSYRAAMMAAVRALGGRAGTVIVVTDLQAAGWSGGDEVEIPDDAMVEVRETGEPPPNLAVTALGLDGGRLVAMVRNTAGEAREAVVRFALDGAEAGTVAVTVPAGGLADAVLASPQTAAEATATVVDEAGIPGDNARFAVLDGGAGADVMVVTANGAPAQDAFYVEQALEVQPGASTMPPFHVVGVRGADLGGPDEAALADAGAVLLLSTRGLEPRGRQRLAAYVRNGGGLLATSGPEVDGEIVADVLGTSVRMETSDARTGQEDAHRTIAPVDARHPIFRAFGASAASLGLATFSRIARVAGEGCVTLARYSTSEPALLECPEGAGRALVFASDLDAAWNDFPKRATFVPFLQEAVRYLASGRELGRSFLVGATPPGLASTPGFASLSDGAGRVRRVAVNVDPRESASARLPVDDFLARLAPAAPLGDGPPEALAAREQERGQHLWQYAIGLMLVVLVLESFVAARSA